MRTAALPRAWLCALLASCTASGEDVRPPDDQLFFPTGMALGRPRSGPASVLFVANSNSELRYDSGAIAVIDLARVDQAIAAWNAGDGTLFRDDPVCSRDPEHRETQVCEEREFMIQSAGVRIGNFATDIAVQSFDTHLRVIVPTRGDPSITWADFDGARLTCAGGTTAFPLCDAAHRLSSVRDQGDGFPIVDEPFGVFADADDGGFAVVTHLIAGALTLVDSPADGRAQITDTVTNVFLAPPNVPPAASAVVGRPGQGTSDLIYVGSSTENRIQTFTVGRPVNESAPYLVPGGYFLVDGVGGNSGGSSETRGMQFSADGNRLYVVNRRPPSLSIFDTSIGPTGTPRNAPTGSTDICRQAATVAVLELGADDLDGERAYVTCFQGGQVYVIDPRGQSQVEDVLTVGRGPYAAVALGQPGEPKRLFISNTLEDTIAVVDVDPRSPGYNRVVLRIGLPKREP